MKAGVAPERKRSDPVAVVTGAAGGVGRAVVARLRGTGYRVVATDLRAPRVAGALGLAMDVRETPSVARARNTVVRRFGRVDVLVCCAGVLRARPLMLHGEADWRETLDVNLVGVFRCIRSFAEAMMRTGGGRIVVVASVAARRGLPGAAAYAASKAGAVSLARTAAVELAAHDISVFAVAPGIVDTDMAAAHRRALEAQGLPTETWRSPVDVAKAIVSLATGESARRSGSCIELPSDRFGVTGGTRPARRSRPGETRGDRSGRP